MGRERVHWAMFVPMRMREVLQAMANIVAVAINDAEMYQTLHEKEEQIQAAGMQCLVAFAGYPMLDYLGQLVGVLFLILGVIQEFFGDGIPLEAACGEVVVLVAQQADELGGECVVEDSDHALSVMSVGGRHGSEPHILLCAFTELPNVREERGFLRPRG